MDAKLRASRERPHGSAGGEGIRRHRMRFSVRVPAQNVSFRRVRFSSPGQTRRLLTENRSLGVSPSRKSALCDPQIAQNAPFRHVAAPGRCGATTRQAAGHYGEWPNWANALEQPPPACGAGCARVCGSRFGVWPHGKAHSARPVGSRMRFSVTTRPQNALFREGPCAECAFP